MILSPWPMILRSLPITDFSPVEGELITLLVLVGVVVRGPSGCGPADELRVNMKSPNEIGPAFAKQSPRSVFLAPHLTVAYRRCARKSNGAIHPQRRRLDRALPTSRGFAGLAWLRLCHHRCRVRAP
jgi:hypothetical protein